MFLLLHGFLLYCLAEIKYHFFVFILFSQIVLLFTHLLQFVLLAENVSLMTKIDDFGNPSFISGPLNLTTFSQLSFPVNQLTSD